MSKLFSLKIKNQSNRYILYILMLFLLTHVVKSQVLLEAESFNNKGGWVSDAQFMDQMGSPYLMAHGLGKPVANAKTYININKKSTYRVWVRTYNWISPWFKDGDGPGAFQIKVNGTTLSNILGTKGSEWMWQEAGIIDLTKINTTEVVVELIDLTGFNGRVDAILFSEDINWTPPNNTEEIAALRRALLNIPDTPVEAGQFDLVVVGGGVAGCSAALAAARLGLKVAIIQNRPVLGGNNSTEIGVSLVGAINKNYYPRLGNMLRELTRIPIPLDSHLEEGVDNAPPKRGPSSSFDQLRENILNSEKNISLFLNIHVNNVQSNNNSIIAVIGKDTETGINYRFEGTYFADCTGDGTVGYLAGADYKEGRESYSETFESKAPIDSDKHHLGTTIMWKSVNTGSPKTFPVLPWAAQLSNAYFINDANGGWDWESGFSKNSILDAEHIRDNLFRAIYGNWSYLKNNLSQYSNHELSTISFVAGKRESRRLLGDVILTENDIFNKVDYPDKSFTATWPIDLHYPTPKNSLYFPGEEWQSQYDQTEIPSPYHVPYRTLYSRNIKNLFMAGRCISVTHVALGSVRVMATSAMMGEVVGIAAKVCMNNNALPRDVYEKHLIEFQNLMISGVPVKSTDRDWFIYQDTLQYSLSNEWIFTRKYGTYTETVNMIDDDRATSRGMAYKDGKLLFPGRKYGNRILIADAKTGIQEKPVVLASNIFMNGSTKASVNANNDIRVDDAGNVLVSNLVTTLSETFQVWKIDLNTGNGVLIINQNSLNINFPDITKIRLDGFSVKGDVNSDAVIMALNGQAMEVYRWTISNGKVNRVDRIKLDNRTPGTSLTGISTLGYAGGDIKIMDTGFLLDTENIHPVFIDYNGNVADNLANNTDMSNLIDKSFSGVTTFNLGNDKFLLANAVTTSGNPASSFRLFRFDNTETKLSELTYMWNIPIIGFGNLTNSGRRGIPVVEVVNDTANIYLYAPANGYAKYQLTPKNNTTSVKNEYTSDVKIINLNNRIIFTKEVTLAEVYSITGQRVAFADNVIEFNHHFTKGIYIIRIIDQNNSTKTQKIIVN